VNPPAHPAPGRVLPLRRAVAEIARLRRRRPEARVVLANGLFDLLHVGHVRYLRAARRLGDILVVAVNDDRSARLLRGRGRPIVGAADRARLVAALEGVDFVVLFGGRTVAPIIRRLRPDVQCKGTDYTPESVPERDVVRSYGGRVAIAGDRKRHATTDMIGRIRRLGRR
jgi:rfaE bifunctional protein nucleotidyltransferase chain/domain